MVKGHSCPEKQGEKRRWLAVVVKGRKNAPQQFVALRRSLGADVHGFKELQTIGGHAQP